MKLKRLTIVLLSLSCGVGAVAEQPDGGTGKWNPLDSLAYKVELQSSLSNGTTPLWLNANKYGLSSLDESNGYARVDIHRPLSADDGRKFGLGYGVDVVAPYNYTSNFVVQQAYVEGRWLHGVLTIGARQQPMQMKNRWLSSGSQTLGINARPIPEVRLALPQYWTIPLTRGWLHLKGHFAFGNLTDGNWQRDFAAGKNRYVDKTLYNSKAGYLMIGNPEKFVPWSFEAGLEMVTYFGGKMYTPNGDGTYSVRHGGTHLDDYWKTFWGFGHEDGETHWRALQGDVLGSWVARINYDGEVNSYHVYADKFFEDHSAMFQLEYDGYGSGDEWLEKKKNHYLLYDLKDMMLGFEFNHKPDAWINDIVFEYLYTKYQSGPIYHDHSPQIPDHLGGKDRYYNHGMYSGHQHWGQVMGNPLYRSPIYNSDGALESKDNRFVAFHLGLGGHPNEYLRYRLLASYQEGWGTYTDPYTRKRHNMSLLAEGTYNFHSLRHNWWNGFNVTAGLGADFGSILGGPNYGFQLTVAKSGLIKF